MARGGLIHNWKKPGNWPDEFLGVAAAAELLIESVSLSGIVTRISSGIPYSLPLLVFLLQRTLQLKIQLPLALYALLFYIANHALVHGLFFFFFVCLAAMFCQSLQRKEV